MSWWGIGFGFGSCHTRRANILCLANRRRVQGGSFPPISIAKNKGHRHGGGDRQENDDEFFHLGLVRDAGAHGF
jgi:hypothetical protein